MNEDKCGTDYSLSVTTKATLSTEERIVQTGNRT